MSIRKDDITQQWYFDIEDYIISETDGSGIITYANQGFCEIAGYNIDELLGQPHNIVRHPDMPKIAFKGLWDDVKNKGFWTGYVKNTRKDGGFYWVYATVMRKIDSSGKSSYLSVRVPVLRNVTEQYKEIYAKLRDKE